MKFLRCVFLLFVCLESLTASSVSGVADYGFMQWNDGVRGSTYQIRTSHFALRYDHRKPGIMALQALPFHLETTAHETRLPNLRAVEMSCAVQTHETSHLARAASDDSRTELVPKNQATG